MLTLNTQEIAQLLGVTREHVTNKIVKRPDFPKPTINASQKMRKWAQHEVLAYFRGERRSAPASRDSMRPAIDGDPDAH